MRQEHETAASFKELQEITQAIHALKKGVPKNATNQASANERLEKTQENTSAKAHTQARAQTSENANTSDLTQATALKLKATAQAKNNFKPGLTTHQSNQKGGKNED
ncbi:hypothetical protein JT173_05385 [Helicobacter pylori]|nr:hypothetical protein [Helicobacter pylori]